MPPVTVGPKSWLDSTMADLGLQQAQPLLDDAQQQQAQIGQQPVQPSLASSIPSLSSLLGMQQPAPAPAPAQAPSVGGWLSSIPGLDALLGRQPAQQPAQQPQQPGMQIGSVTLEDGRQQPGPSMRPGETLGDVSMASGNLRDWARAEAQRLGIDPDIAERVAMSEGGFDDPVRQSDVVYQGEREQSYGPYQLNVNGGLGNEAIARGIDPRNPAHARQAVTFALEHAARNGWGNFHGAARVGVGQWDGIGQAPVQGPRMTTPMAAEQTPAARGQQASGFDVGSTLERYAGGTYTFGGGRDQNGLGVPGARDTDCSGFVSSVWREQGIAMPAHTDAAYEQLRGLGAAQVSERDAQPGDVVFYMGAGYGGNVTYHMGIYAGPGQVLDASSRGGQGVRIRPLTHAGGPEDIVILRDPRVNGRVDQRRAEAPPEIQPTGIAESPLGERLAATGGASLNAGASPPPAPSPVAPGSAPTAAGGAPPAPWETAGAQGGGPTFMKRGEDQNLPEPNPAADFPLDRGRPARGVIADEDGVDATNEGIPYPGTPDGAQPPPGRVIPGGWGLPDDAMYRQSLADAQFLPGDGGFAPQGYEQSYDPDQGPREATPGSVGSQPLPQTDNPMSYGPIQQGEVAEGPPTYDYEMANGGQPTPNGDWYQMPVRPVEAQRQEPQFAEGSMPDVSGGLKPVWDAAGRVIGYVQQAVDDLVNPRAVPGYGQVSSTAGEPDYVPPTTSRLERGARGAVDFVVENAERGLRSIGQPNWIGAARMVGEFTEPMGGAVRQTTRLEQIEQHALEFTGGATGNAVRDIAARKRAVEDPRWRQAFPDLAEQYDQLQMDLGLNVMGQAGDTAGLGRGFQRATNTASQGAARVPQMPAVDGGPGIGRALASGGDDAMPAQLPRNPEAATRSGIADSGPNSPIGTAQSIEDAEATISWGASQRMAESIPPIARQAPDIASAPELIEELRRTDFVPASRVVEMIGQRPEYLGDVANFMVQQRRKVVEGNLTPRDVAKAYYMTVASQGADAVKVATIEAKVPGFRIPEQFWSAERAADGSPLVRPEEAAAAWLFTPRGQQALDEIERGIFNREAWAEGASVRRAFGDDRFRTTNVFSERAPVDGRTKFNMEHIGAFTDLFNQAARSGDLAALDRATLRLNGVREGKLGFIKHALGFGESPTIDAVEINTWLTGQGDISRLQNQQAKLVRTVNEWLRDPRVGQYLRERITGEFAAIRGMLPPEATADLPDEVFNHVLHHWIWDKMKGTATTHEGFYEAMRNAATLGASPGPRGAGIGTRLATDLGNSVGGGVAGATYSVATGDEENLPRNVALGMVGAPLLGRGMRRAGGALGTPGVGPNRAAEAPREPAPVFYSQLRRTLDEKMPNRANGQQIMGILRGSPVKPDEIAWTGLDDWLRQQRGPVTKQQVLDFLDQNAVQVEEVVKGEPLIRWRQNGDALVAAEAPTLRVVQDADGSFRVQHDGRVSPVPFTTVDEAKQAAQDIATDPKVGLIPRPSQTRYGQYTLPGGENYRELLITQPDRTPNPNDLPEVKAAQQRLNEIQQRLMAGEWGNRALLDERAELEQVISRASQSRVADDWRASNYRSSHWDEPNVLAHVRFNERVAPDGKRVLLIEEIQSDWHQAGRKQGYNATPRELTADELELQALNRASFQRDWTPGERARAEQLRAAGVGDTLAAWATAKSKPLVPDAPFKKTWPELAIKRMIRWAAENGFDRIAWPPGSVHAERFGLARQVDNVTAVKGRAGISLTVQGRDGRNIMDSVFFRPEEYGKIEETLGQDLARKIIGQAEPEMVYRGDDLMMGGDGMKGFYDKIVPETAQKIGKKFGARVGTSEVALEQRYRVTNAQGRVVAPEADLTPDEIADWRSKGLTVEPAGRTQPVHSMDITPQMRESVVYQGQPQFAALPFDPTSAAAGGAAGAMSEGEDGEAGDPIKTLAGILLAGVGGGMSPGARARLQRAMQKAEALRAAGRADDAARVVDDALRRTVPGYDGIAHKGGQRVPMFDSTGQPIEHDVTVVFPDRLDRIRNAFSGEYGGAWPAWARPGSGLGTRVAADLGASIQGAGAGAVYSVATGDEENLGRNVALGAAGMPLLGRAVGRGMRGQGRGFRAGIVPPHVADQMGDTFPVRIPQDPKVIRAIEAIGGTVDPERGVTINVTRAQGPQAAGQAATRGGVFYEAVPEGGRSSFVRGSDDPTGVGGSQVIPARPTRFRSPLIVSDAPGSRGGFAEAMEQLQQDAVARASAKAEEARAAYEAAVAKHGATVPELQARRDAFPDGRAGFDVIKDGEVIHQAEFRSEAEAWLRENRIGRADIVRSSSDPSPEWRAADAALQEVYRAQRAAVQAQREMTLAQQVPGYDDLINDIFAARRAGPDGSEMRAHALREVVRKYGGDPELIDPLLRVRGADASESEWAIRENILAAHARRNGYDGVVTVGDIGPNEAAVSAHPKVVAAKEALAEANAASERAYAAYKAKEQELLGEYMHKPNAPEFKILAERAEQDPTYLALRAEGQRTFDAVNAAEKAYIDASTAARKELGGHRITELVDVREGANPTPGAKNPLLAERERAIARIEEITRDVMANPGRSPEESTALVQEVTALRQRLREMEPDLPAAEANPYTGDPGFTVRSDIQRPPGANWAGVPFDPASAAAGGAAGAMSEGEDGEQGDPWKTAAALLVAGVGGGMSPGARRRLESALRKAEALKAAGRDADAAAVVQRALDATPGYEPRLSREPVLPGMEPPRRAPGDAGPSVSDAPNRPPALGDVPPSAIREPLLPGMDPVRDAAPLPDARAAIGATGEPAPVPTIRGEGGQTYLPTMQPGVVQRIRARLANWGGRVNTLRYAGMLSDTAGHAFNAASNLVLQAADVATTPIAAGIDAARSVVTGKPREAFLREIGPRLGGMWSGARAGLQDAAEIMRTGVRPDEVTKLEQQGGRGFGTDIPGIAPAGSRAANAINLAVEAPLRALAAADAVFRGAATGGHAAAEAYAAARKANGGRPPSPEQVAAALFDPKVRARVDELAARSVLQEDRRLTSWWRDAMLKAPPEVRAVVGVEMPFVRTPYNVMAQGVGVTPAGLLGLIEDVAKGEAPREMEQRVARVALGTAVMAWAASDYAEGNLTGPFPTDQAESSTLPPGWRPWSRKVEVGGETYYVPLVLLGPFAVPAVAAILGGESIKRGKDALSAEWAGAVALGIGRYAEQNTFFEGFAAISKAFDERTGEASLERHLEQIVTQFSPHVVGGGALGREVQRIVGMPARDPEGMLEALLATHPATAEQVRPRQDILGREQSLGVSGPAAAVVRAGVEDDAGVIRAFRGAREGISRPPKSIKDPASGVTRALDADQRARWQRVFGRELRQGWTNAGNPRDADSLRKIEADSRSAANETVLGRR